MHIIDKKVNVGWMIVLRLVKDQAQRGLMSKDHQRRLLGTCPHLLPWPSQFRVPSMTWMRMQQHTHRSCR